MTRSLAVAVVASSEDDPEERIANWFATLYRLKRKRAIEDPEMYRAFDLASTHEKRFVVTYLDALIDQLTHLVARADASAVPAGSRDKAELLFRATAAFHHPALVAQTAKDDHEPQLRQIVTIFLNGTKRHAAGR